MAMTSEAHLTGIPIRKIKKTLRVLGALAVHNFIWSLTRDVVCH